mmetsp:Transcript_27907/g.66461  ORF Transcript_27907/g.66461 Transcript_27907/m.66461 type:complete len:83 (+) Transcript_27907:623-871(+)
MCVRVCDNADRRFGLGGVKAVLENNLRPDAMGEAKGSLSLCEKRVVYKPPKSRLRVCSDTSRNPGMNDEMRARLPSHHWKKS